MRVVTHLVSMLLIVPQLLLFAAIRLAHDVTAIRTIKGLLVNALDALSFVFGWGGAVCLLAFLILALIGFSTRWRPFATTFVLVIDVLTAASLAVWLRGAAIDGVLFVLAPGILAFVLGTFLLRRDLQSAHARA